MLMFEERLPAIGTLNGWAISVLRKAGAIREREEHGWTQDRAARMRASEIARQDPPQVASEDEAVAELVEVLDSIGDTCPSARRCNQQHAREVEQVCGVSFSLVFGHPRRP
ncbi:hypothetical protein [Bradyrhizobium sp. RT7b]|uniref:hypothetical protein n=1 Tax=unclassified Bradyrhizobium TaxID=2631580 RepID=UPI0033939BBD